MQKKIIKQTLRSFLCCLLGTGLLLSQTGAVFAEAAATDPTPTPDPHSAAYYTPADTNSIEGWPEGPLIESTSAILIDYSTGAVLYSKSADMQLYPASITKIMTTLLACEHLNMKDKLVVSQSAAFGIEPGSSSIAADTDEEFTVHQALMAVMLESANEMSLAVSEAVSGSTKKFVELMNERAAELGCTNTHFNNPNGLPDETHVTTASDMSKIAQAAWKNPLFRKYCSTSYYEIPPTNKQPETRYMLNHHKMMSGGAYAYEGVLGGKTGYTEAAGNTLVTFAKRGKLGLIAVVLNSPGTAYTDTAALLDYGFDNFKRMNMKVDREPVISQTLPGEEFLLTDGGNLAPFYYMSNVYVTVPSGTDRETLEKQQELASNAAGPLLLKSTYYFNGHAVGYGTQYERCILPTLFKSPE